MIIALVAISFGQNGSDGSGRKRDERIIKLKENVAAFHETVKEPYDLEKLADITHPRVFERVGGRDSFKKVMKQELDKAKSTFASLEWTFGDPTKIIEFNNQLFSIVPRVLKGTSTVGKRVITEGTIIAISSDRGRTWKFINGDGFRASFPEYADVVQAPKTRILIDGIEQ